MSIEQELISAVYSRDRQKVASLFEVPGVVSPDTCTSDGFPVLFVAASYGYKEMVEILLQVGANIDLPDKDGATPLYIAAYQGYKEVVEVLLKAGAKIDLGNKNGVTPLYIAAHNGYREVAEVLLGAGASIDLANKNGATPLLIAAQNGYREIAELLLGSGASIDLVNKDGVTALYIAAHQGHKDLVALFLKARANVDLAPKDGMTPLCVAAEKGYKEIVAELLRAGARVNLANKNGFTALCFAAERGHKEVVELLLRVGANIDSAQKDGATPLLVASQNGHTEVVEVLLRAGAKVDFRMNCGATPLYAAAQNGHKEVVEVLIRAGANIDSVSKTGCSPQAIADYRGHKEVVKLLQRARLWTRLQSLLSGAYKILDPIEARNEMQLLPLNEQFFLRDLMSHLRSLKPDTLDEITLNREIFFIEGRQTYLAEMQKKIVVLGIKHAKVLANLRSKLQELVNATNKIILPIEERNEAIWLPQDESRELQDFITHLKSLTLDTLDEVRLNSEIALLESKQKYLKAIQKKIAKEKAEKVTALQKAINSFNLKFKAAELAGDLEGIREYSVFIQDHYRQIAALGIDCSRELAAIEQKIKEIYPTPAAVFPTMEDALQCRIIPHAELQLEQKLGSGVLGSVYRGLWHLENIAVKKLHLVQLTPNSRQTFISEVTMMTKLDSERLVRLYGVCVAPDPYCIVMEYMQRGSLYNLLHSSEQYSWQVALQIAIDIGNGLTFLHREKVIHRDLKSLNVLLDSHYRAKICDFGLMKVRQEVSVTSAKAVNTLGTNVWSAPELFGLHPQYSFASDIYAYGIILWELLTRKAPYQDVLDPNEIKTAVKAGEREAIPATSSATYRETIERCWAQVPEHRPQALQVVQALQTEFAGISVKSWHIAPELEPHDSNQEGSFFIPAGDYDMRKVVAAYQRCPVPGMEVGMVTVIFNPVLNKSFADKIELLERRSGNPAFAATWDTDGDATTVAWRREVIRRFAAMAHPYQDSACPQVKIMPVWHGTQATFIESIARTGYANLATTDLGGFGGVYGSYEAEYIYRVHGPRQYGAAATLLVNWIACFSPYPIVGYSVPGYTGVVTDPGDMVCLQAKGSLGNYDAHFIPLRPRTSAPDEVNYYPCRPNESATYHEIVVFDKTQILPRYIVELQPSLVAPPSVAPLLAMMGMFGEKQEQEAAAPAPAP